MLGSHPKQHNKSNSLPTLLGTKPINSDVLSCEKMQVFLGRKETCPPMRGVLYLILSSIGNGATNRAFEVPRPPKMVTVTRTPQ